MNCEFERGKADGCRMPQLVFRFLFSLNSDVAGSGEFRCKATNVAHAWDILRTRMPGAERDVKAVSEVRCEIG